MAKNSYKDESGDKQYFTIIPNYIANHSSANDQALYFQMKRIAGEKEGVCYASEKYFKDKLKIGSKALKKSIQYLLDNKWIQDAGIQEMETKGGIQKSHLYIVKDIWGMNVNYYKGVSESRPLNVKGVSESNQRGVQKESKGGRFQATKKNKEKKNIKKTNIFSSYKQKINSGSILTDKAKKKIVSRLKIFTEDQLLKAIDNFSKAKWWMENNSSRGIAWFFHSDDRIDQFINLKSSNKSKIEKMYG